MKDGRYVILCVDDDPDIIDTLRIVLEAHDYIMISADNAGEGLLKFQECQPDLVIIDLMMEEVDAGTQLVTKIRAEQHDAIVYLLSSVGDQLHQMTDTAALGLAGTFQKPIHPAQLLRTLEAKLKGRG